MSGYFPPRPSEGGATNLFGASGQKAAKTATNVGAGATRPAPLKLVTVKAHTRVVADKSPKGKPVAQVKTPPVTQSARPSNASNTPRFAPNFPGEPIAGFIGTYPYYTNTSTLAKRAGPAGDEGAQLNAAQVAKAHRIQVANYGTPGYIARSLVPGGLSGGATSVADAITRGVGAATLALPGGGVTEAAGLFGLGLRGFRGLRVGKDILEVGKAAPEVVAAKPVTTMVPRTAAEAQAHVTALEAQHNAAADLLHVQKHGAPPSPQAEAARARQNETTRLAQQGYTKVGRDELKDRAKMDAQREKVVALESKGASPALSAARAKLAKMESDHDALYRGKKLNLGHPVGNYGKRPIVPSVLEERRAAVEKEIDDAIARDPAVAEVPQVKAWLARREEIGQLRTALAEHNLPEFAREPGAGTSAPDFGMREVSTPGAPAPIAPIGPAHLAEEAAAVRAALRGAKIVRGRQEAGYSVERAKRVAAARVHLENPNLTPAERIGKAKGELVGELPKINFHGFSELNDQSLQALQTHILDHPNLMPFQKIRASDALTNALAGKVPTRSEITLLEHVFGKDTAVGLAGIAAHPLRDRILSVLNIPRSLMASFDLSAPFRQGLVVSTRHPTIFFRNFGSMIRAFGSERVYHGMLDEIRARPTYPLMLEAKLPITELGRDVGGREEQFASDYAEKLTGGKYGPVRASGRAYTGFLDKTRADVFDHLIASAQGQGINVQDPEFLRSIGRYIGSATGRGDLGHFQEAGKVLNAFFFSPRLLASRLNFLNPVYYARLDPFARREALRSAVQLAGTLSVLLELANHIPGAKVVSDPRNPDWGKIRLGNTRLDFGGGFQQPLRLLAQLGTGVAISSTTGKKLALTAGGFGQPTRLDIALRFFQGKESPIASLVTDWLRGSNQIGQPFSWQSAAVQRMTPLLGQDAFDLYKDQHGGMNGLLAAFAGYGIGAFGTGIQTYGPPAPKSTGSPGYFGSSGSSGGGSPYFSSPSSSGGNGYFGP